MRTVADTVTTSDEELLDLAMNSGAGRRDPYPFLRVLLARGEYSLLPDGRSFVYGYRPGAAILRSPAFLKHGEHASSASPRFTPEQVEILDRERPDAPGMLSSLDDPDHARLRRLVSHAFTPRVIEPYEQLIRDTLDHLLADVDTRAPIDLVATVNSQIPSQVVGQLIGLPLPDRDMFAHLAGLQSLGRDPDASFDDHLTAVRARREMYAYVADLIDSERAAPGDTPVGRLIRLEQQGGKISRAELISLLATVYSAGFGTTVRMLGNGLVGLLQHPDQAAYLRENPKRVRQVTDELLRFDTPVMTVAYYAGDGAMVGDRPLEPGSLCTVIVGAANHDHRVFADPDILDVTRPPRRQPAVVRVRHPLLHRTGAGPTGRRRRLLRVGQPIPEDGVGRRTVATGHVPGTSLHRDQRHPGAVVTGRLDGKRVVLIGAGQARGPSIGIGRATSLLFAREGARLMLVDRDTDAAEETRALITAEGSDAIVQRADVTSAADCDALSEATRAALGGVDVLFNGVGILGPGLAGDVDEDLWDTVMDTNLKGMWLSARSLLPLMIEQKSGSIVFISSIGGIRGGTSSVYGVSKAGVNRLVKSVAATYAAHDIRANAIMPGLMDTPMAIDSAIEGTEISRDELVREREAKIPMAYKGSAWDVAYAALYFASDESRYVSGACLPVDGAVLAAR